MKRLFLIILAACSCTIVMAQQRPKISAATRMVIADRQGKLDMQAPQDLKDKMVKKEATFLGGDMTTFDNIHPTATPSVVEGVEMVQCWIRMTDQNYGSLEALGVKIHTKFDDRVVANVPVGAIELVANLKNVVKVSVSKKLKTNTYRSRVLTNVDDVLTLSSDAQAAGLTQAYDGTGVVLGVIDTGIDFGHSMFSGRIKKKYVFNTNTEALEEYTGNSYYYNGETHGTHTSSIAGGSSASYTAYVYTTSSSYSTVNNASFGGMAPGTDLVLCDLGEELTDANIAACIKNISDYADEVGKPCVISLSLGGHYGPHDGTGDMADVCAQYTGPGKIILFASGNEGEDGIYHYKQATKSSPAQTVLSSQTRSSYSMDFGAVMTYARTPNTELAVRYYVVNTNNNSILWTSNEITTDDYFEDDQGNIELYGAEISVNDTGSDGSTKLSSYFTAYNNDSNNYGFLCCYMDQDEHNDKWYVETILYYLKPVNNNYKIGMSVYPKNNGTTTYIDSWPISYIDFTASSASVNGNTFTAGGNHCSISNEGTFPSVISVGAYCSSPYWRSNSTMYGSLNWTDNPTYQGISTFSSYQREGYGPLGTKLPWITAPGEVIIAAYNSGYSTDSYYYYYGTNKKLGAMSGTSMACPCAAGITAIWLQVNPALTPDQVKNVMSETAITDSYTSGTYSYMFGQGKIDALAGVKYLLEHAGPTINANPRALSFFVEPGTSQTQSVIITSNELSNNITITLNDANGVFSIDKNSITEAGTLNVTFLSNTEGTYSGSIILSSTDANPVTINLTAVASEGGTASDAYLDIAKYATIDVAGWNNSLVDNFYKYTEYNSQGCAWLTLPAYSAVVGAKYAVNDNTFGNGQPQKWVDTNITSTSGNPYTGSVTWTNTASATSPYWGNSTYFTSANSRAIGNNSSSSTTTRTVIFYVTNTTEVKLLGKMASRSTTNYPTTLKAYVCTKNSDGSLTASTTAAKSASYGTANGTADISITELDENVIYKVEASVTRGYLYEVAFKTSLNADPEITANPTALEFTANVNKTHTKTFTVTGANLTGNITASLSGRTDLFSIDKTTISQSNGSANATVTVSFTPTEPGGPFSGAVTLTSNGASPVTVSLTGTATEPELVVTPTELTLIAPVGDSANGSFGIIGENLNGPVTLTLNDANGVFSINETSVSAGNALEGVDINVTFNPQAEGSYTATVTVSTEGLDDQTVTLKGTASKGYVDVTVSRYGLSTLYTDVALEIPYDTYDDLLGVYYAYSFSVDEGEIRIRRINDYIPAYTGVIIQGNAGTYRFPAARVAVDPIQGNVLSGSMEDQSVSDIEGTVMTLGMGSNGYFGFYKYSGTTLSGGKAYVVIPDDQIKTLNTLSMVIGKESDDATGIEYIFAKPDTGTNDEWYTIQGLRLNGKPTEKGFYIHGGKTVLVK